MQLSIFLHFPKDNMWPHATPVAPCCTSRPMLYLWPHVDEEEPGGDRDLGEVSQECCLSESDEDGDGPREEVDLPHQNVGGLGPRGDLTHEVSVALKTQQLS